MSSLILFIFTFNLYSQTNKKSLFYLDTFLITSNKDNFEYIKEIKDYDSNKKDYAINIYYKSGKKYLIGTTSDKDKVVLEGKCLYYYENGKKKRIANYKNNKLIGEQFYYHENGVFKLESEIEVSKNKKESILKIHNYFDENNIQKVVNGEGEFLEEEEKYKQLSKGMIKNFVKEGIWVGSINNKKINFIEQYSNGKLVIGNSTDSLNNKYTYNEIIEKAHPKKGINDFYSYLKKSEIIPKGIDGQVRGKILLSFDITDTGNLINISAYSADQYGITENAIKIVSQYDNWMPAKYKGVNIKTHFTLPITFK